MGTDVVFPVLCLIVGVLMGYWMGRNSAERPFISEEQPRKVFDPGPTHEPEEDLFRDALEDPYDDMAQPRRIPTINVR